MIWADPYKKMTLQPAPAVVAAARPKASAARRLVCSRLADHRTDLDLLAAGALLGLGIKELLNKEDADSAPPGWTRKLDQFCAMPLPLLLAGPDRLLTLLE
jgi:hypothetical protein